MRIVTISDTHEKHHSVRVPWGDVLIHTGDATYNGSRQAVTSFLMWLEEQPHEYKVFVAGNHDRLFESDPEAAKELLRRYAPSVNYLNGTSVVLSDPEQPDREFVVWGTPYTPKFYDWAFQFRRNSPEAEALWASIPSNVDILLTHGPSFGILDLNPHGTHVGCEVLRERIRALPRLKAHVFGHIHHSYGIIERNGVVFANSAICDEGYQPTRKPHEFDL